MLALRRFLPSAERRDLNSGFLRSCDPITPGGVQCAAFRIVRIVKSRHDVTSLGRPGEKPVGGAFRLVVDFIPEFEGYAVAPPVADGGEHSDFSDDGTRRATPSKQLQLDRKSVV